MKNKYIYILPLLILLMAGCLKNAQEPIIDSNYTNFPLGNFSGKFTLVHKNSTTLKYDTTAPISLQLVLSTTTGYAVTGDTSTIHAGSYGSFIENNTNINLNDVTYPAMGKPTKIHLSGAYLYTFDGTNFKITGASGDTLAYTYDFVKIK